MTLTGTRNLERKIKKSLYGRPQSALVIFPAGFSEIAMEEIRHILANLWFPQKLNSELILLKNEIRITNIHIFALIELLMRSQCLTDVRLIIYEGKTLGKSSFESKCRAIDWDMYLNKNMLVKIRVDSVASRAFHESGLKQILTEILSEYVDEIISGENVNETTCIYADLLKNKLTVTLSLAGVPLYKRGYRGVLSASAPLREDVAACCITKALQFAKMINKKYFPEVAIIPFSGTGTFVFEYFLVHSHLPPALLGCKYAIQRMPFFKAEHFNYLLKKEKPEIVSQPYFFCIDTSSQANSALLSNLKKFNETIEIKHVSICEENFLQTNFNKMLLIDQTDNKAIFMPLNPPYGLRLSKNSDTVAFYKKIAEKINEIASLLSQKNGCLAGFILCPNEETWSVFYKTLTQCKRETYHFTQGGLDIRVCNFLILYSPLFAN